MNKQDFLTSDVATEVSDVKGKIKEVGGEVNSQQMIMKKCKDDELVKKANDIFENNKKLESLEELCSLKNEVVNIW